MEEKPAELPVSEQEVQIQPLSILDKLKPHKFKILGGVLGVFILAGAVFAGYKFAQIRQEREQARSRLKQIEWTQCEQDEDCVLAIRLDQCCSCPEAVSREALEKELDLVEYMEGKDYSQEKTVNCEGIVCEPCGPPPYMTICSEGKCQIKYQAVSDETADWKTYSSQCGFIIKYPEGWRAGGVPICGSLRAPNWQEGDVPEPRGLSLRFSRWERGTKTSVFSKGVLTPLTINTLEDYIKSHGNDGEQVSGVKDKTYGELSGKEFTLTLEGEATSYTYFIFMRDDFIYTADWENKYIENYRDNINLMLSTFRFLE